MKETKHKKISPQEMNDLGQLENKVHDLLQLGVKLINDRFLPLRGKLSPKISVMQNIMDIYPDKCYKDRYLENNGFTNFHLCINAATEIEHTEHDSSYTVIVVPNQETCSKSNGFNSRARFELVINESTTILINMYPGGLFTYSGYMLTHRQQLKSNMKDAEMFVNIVSYNSKRLFCNVMESFQRDIKEDKKSISEKKTKIN